MKFENTTPIYDIAKSYLENAEEGPFFKGEIPKRLLTESYDFLGYRVASRIGIPAGPLLNAKWIKLAADLHYDILCYKTIRSKEWKGHPVPNIVYIDGDLQLERDGGAITQKLFPPEDMSTLGITNSFGMPSRSPQYLHIDIPKANKSLHSGQAMIVSVVGSTDRGDFFQDFVEAALLAKECGAHIIEANYSCPNVASKEGSLYLDPEMIFALTQRISRAISPIPLIIKVGCYPNAMLLEEACQSISRGGARAIAGINTISKEVLSPAGAWTLGPERKLSGICGAPIRHAALKFIRDSRHIIDKNKLDLVLIGCGGITMPEHFDQFFNSGAHIAMTATGMMWDPYLALKYHQEHSCLYNN